MLRIFSQPFQTVYFLFPCFLGHFFSRKFRLKQIEMRKMLAFDGSVFVRRPFQTTDWMVLKPGGNNGISTTNEPLHTVDGSELRRQAPGMYKKALKNIGIYTHKV